MEKQKMATAFRARLVTMLAVLLTATGFASTPSSGAINTPTSDTFGVKQTINYSGGPIANGLVGDVIVANTATFTCKNANPPTACDWFDLDVNVPASFYSNHIGLLQIHVTWQPTVAGTDPALNDLDMYIVDSNNNNVAESIDSNQPALGNDKAEETVALFDPKPGHYRILVVGSTVVTPVPQYNASVTYSLVQAPTPPAATSSIFQNFVPPLPANAGDTRMGTGEGEPSIGVNLSTGNAMVQSGLETIRMTFNDSTYPSTATWTDVGSLITSTISLDPILWTDPRTNRTFVSQLMGGCSLMAWTDDDGNTWTQSPIGCGEGTGIDHQTVGGGPFASPLTSTDVVGHYPDSVVYCAQAVADAQCAMSTNGGLVFGPGIPTYELLDCDGLHGHIRVGPEGNLYLPNVSCGGGAAMIVSKDNGLTWTISHLPNSTVNPFGGTSDPWIDVAQDGTVYYGWADGDGHARVAVSHDAGASWVNVFDAGAQVGVVNTEFAAVAAGDPNRAAFSFLGTNTPGDTQSSTFAGDWYLYVSYTYDGGNTWTTYNATPNDPVQRGCVWNGGGGNPCRNLLDFNGITIDKVGRVLVTYTDGCIDDPLDASVRCVSGPDYSKSVLTSVVRQNAGLGLYGAYDGKIFKTAPGAPVLSGLAGNAVNHLTWVDGSDGNSAVTKHGVYRYDAAGVQTLIATLGAAATSYDDKAVTNGVAYGYRVTASNAVGESQKSNEVVLTPSNASAPSAPQNLAAKAKHGGVMLTWGTPASSGTAKITGYKVYRGTAAGAETFLASSSKLNYNDTDAASGTTYYYYVTAVNAVGESAKSNEVSAQPK
jgi:hypothetical protein